MKICTDIAKRFTNLKHIARKFYIGMPEEAILKELSKYTEQNIIEMFDMETAKDGHSKAKSTSNAGGSITDGLGCLAKMEKDTGIAHTQ